MDLNDIIAITTVIAMMGILFEVIILRTHKTQQNNNDENRNDDV